MIDSAAWLSVALAVASIVVTLRDPRRWRIDLRTVVSGVWVTLVLPKIVLYHRHGDAAFLSAGAVTFPPTAVSAAVVCASAFVVAVNVGWMLGWGGGANDRSPPATPDLAVGAPPSPPGFEWMVVLAITAVTLVALQAMESTLAGAHAAFTKVDFGPAPTDTAAYWLHKLTQVAKAGLVYGLLRFAAWGADRRSVAIVAWFATLTVALYLYTGQRIGIALTVLQVLLALQLIGRLRPRTVIAAAAAMLATSTLVVWARETPESTSFVYLDQIVRRYFFEIEKLTAVLSASAGGYPFAEGSWRVLLDVSSPPVRSFNLDGFLGREVLGSLSAVPPSLPGEILFFVGGIALVPVTLLVAAAFGRLERKVYEPGAGWPVFEWRLAGVWALATGYLLLLNSDVAGFALRLLLEMAIFAVGVVAWRVVAGSTPPASAADLVE